MTATDTIAPPQTTELLRTPDQILGPFYPVRRTPIETGDLTQSGRAAGTVLYLSGRVLTCAGKPVTGARVEIWQANAHGRYDHPHDTNPAPLDPNFSGFAVTATGADGCYAFKTIRPVAYPAAPGRMSMPIVQPRDRLRRKPKNSPKACSTDLCAMTTFAAFTSLCACVS